MNDLERKGRELFVHLAMVVVGFAILLFLSAVVGFGLVWLLGDKGAHIALAGIVVMAFLIASGKAIVKGIYAMIYALVAPILRLLRKK